MKKLRASARITVIRGGRLLDAARRRADAADILVDARPHIGSNKLPKVITALRERLESVGSAVRFGARVTDLVVRDGRAIGVRFADGDELIGRAVVAATGHSARDVHALLIRAGVQLEAKPFAMGVRIEHPQPLIDRIQYGRAAGHPKLPAAPYRLAFTPADQNKRTTSAAVLRIILPSRKKGCFRLTSSPFSHPTSLVCII